MAPKQTKKRVNSWWVAKPDDIAQEIFDTVSYLDEQQQDRYERNIRCLRLYGNCDVSGLGPYSHSRVTTPNLPENRVKYNLVSACTDTLASKVSKMKPQVTFLTSGGNWALQEKSKKLTKWVMGAFKANGVYELHQGMFRDGLIMDLGAVKHFTSGGRIVSERCLPSELYVDYADAMYGSPTHMYHVKYVNKETLIQEWGEEYRAVVRESTGVLNQINSSPVNDEEQEYVVVIEAWRLPNSHGEGGKHVICVEKGVLGEIEDYTRPYFPFTFSRWSNPVIGFYGQSLADRLTGNQVEVNKMLRIIQRSFHLGSAFKVFLEYGSKVAKEHINNEIGSIVYYAGAKPEFYTPKTVHEEFFRHLEWLIRSSFEECGISQLSATSKLPTGLDTGSGKALREYNDLETERFAIVAQMYESSFLETARQYVNLAKELKEDGEDMTVVAESKRFVQEIPWSDVAIDDNEFVMQMFPINQLPSRPEGKLAYVQELINSGMVDQLWGLSLLEFPDTEGYTSLKLAPLDSVLQAIDQMLTFNKYVPPEPFQDLKLGLSLMQSAYLRAKVDGAPDNRLELLRRWMASADAMVNKAANAASQVPLANPVSQGGAPMPQLPPAGAPPPGPQGQMPMSPQPGMVA
jgi:hypothetical protein